MRACILHCLRSYYMCEKSRIVKKLAVGKAATMSHKTHKNKLLSMSATKRQMVTADHELPIGSHQGATRFLSRNKISGQGKAASGGGMVVTGGEVMEGE
ncbi:hypothetical protein EVAR_66352_1 [Eumeta japonica]|uniref:Uncharacterized protein n=1 Tax=Eumeta variegata TaxID=151549 RepID=A0A4C1ZVT2_EUMVA|nr:hypothetical protein EVAR_66352_1 [Eumeta japonica]